MNLTVHTALTPELLDGLLATIYDLRPGHVKLWRYLTEEVERDKTVRTNSFGDPTIVWPPDKSQLLANTLGYSRDTIYQGIHQMERAGILMNQIDPRKYSLLKRCPTAPRELESEVSIVFDGRK